MEKRKEEKPRTPGRKGPASAGAGVPLGSKPKTGVHGKPGDQPDLVRSSKSAVPDVVVETTPRSRGENTPKSSASARLSALTSRLESLKKSTPGGGRRAPARSRSLERDARPKVRSSSSSSTGSSSPSPGPSRGRSRRKVKSDSSSSEERSRSRKKSKKSSKKAKSVPRKKHKHKKRARTPTPSSSSDNDSDSSGYEYYISFESSASSEEDPPPKRKKPEVGKGKGKKKGKSALAGQALKDLIANRHKEQAAARGGASPDEDYDSEADWQAMGVAKARSIQTLSTDRRTKSQPPPVKVIAPAATTAGESETIDSAMLQRALSLARDAFGEVDNRAEPINDAYANMVSEALR